MSRSSVSDVEPVFVKGGRQGRRAAAEHGREQPVQQGVADQAEDGELQDGLAERPRPLRGEDPLEPSAGADARDVDAQGLRSEAQSDLGEGDRDPDGGAQRHDGERTPTPR